MHAVAIVDEVKESKLTRPEDRNFEPLTACHLALA